MTELELRDTTAARIAFQRAVRLKKNDSKAWNNLGSVEFVTGNLQAALNDYVHAVKLGKKTVRIGTSKATLVSGKARSLAVKLTKKPSAALRRAIKARLSLTATATAAGSALTTAKAAVRVKR